VNAMMLISGNDSNNAPNLGTRPEISATATMTIAEMSVLTINQTIG